MLVVKCFQVRGFHKKSQMSLLKACQRPLVLQRLNRQSLYHRCNKVSILHQYAKLQRATFAPPPAHGHHHPPPPHRRRPRGPFFRRLRNRLIKLGIVIGAFYYFMDADFVTYGYDLYRTNYDEDGMTDKTIWVVGASSGIGEYLVYQLVKSGAKRIIISSRRKEQLKRVKQECQQLISNINNQNKQKSLISQTLIDKKVNEVIENLADDGQKDLSPAKVKEIEEKVRNELSQNVTTQKRDLECDIIIAPLDMLDFVKKPGAADEYIQKLMQDLNSRLVSENERGGLFVEPSDIDIMVINSGRTQKSLATENELSILYKLQELNVFAPIALSQAMVKYWRNVINEGKLSKKSKKLHQIAVTSSLAGVFGTPKSSAYSMTKFGINGFMEAMRIELVDDKIDINTICPGPIDISKDSLDALGHSINGELRDRREGRVGKDMTLERCAKLYTTALQYSIVESWMANNPTLILIYLRQYLPIALGPMTRLIGPKFAKAPDMKVSTNT